MPILHPEVDDVRCAAFGGRLRTRSQGKFPPTAWFYLARSDGRVLHGSSLGRGLDAGFRYRLRKKMIDFILHTLRTCFFYLHRVINNPLFRRLQYSAEKKDEPQGVVEKATSTAEEFLRRAKEKSEAVGESAKEVVEDAKEAVVGESQERKQRFKEKVEKGNYDNIGRD
ncbi:hypothetical protein BHE74_00012986 [Ensete ventricosum]|nr:hypothetical protein BHE74_00012986 [Ensete ventricosum]RZR91782.1 hypothetical protein BHM03_00019962 [Ensete ventricosum]